MLLAELDLFVLHVQIVDVGWDIAFVTELARDEVPLRCVILKQLVVHRIDQTGDMRRQVLGRGMDRLDVSGRKFHEVRQIAKTIIQIPFQKRFVDMLERGIFWGSGRGRHQSSLFCEAGSIKMVGVNWIHSSNPRSTIRPCELDVKVHSIALFRNLPEHRARSVVLAKTLATPMDSWRNTSLNAQKGVALNASSTPFLSGCATPRIAGYNRLCLSPFFVSKVRNPCFPKPSNTRCGPSCIFRPLPPKRKQRIKSPQPRSCPRPIFRKCSKRSFAAVLFIRSAAARVG